MSSALVVSEPLPLPLSEEEVVVIRFNLSNPCKTFFNFSALSVAPSKPLVKSSVSSAKSPISEEPPLVSTSQPKIFPSALAHSTAKLVNDNNALFVQVTNPLSACIITSPTTEPNCCRFCFNILVWFAQVFCVRIKSP